jgi:conjugal transfer pilus assembly protein TraD
MRHRRLYEQAVVSGDDPLDASLGGSWALHGVEPSDAPLHVPRALLDQHTIIGGTTGTGKTRLLELLALQAIRAGEAVAIIDPKGDRGMLDRVYACAEAAGRADRFRFLSLPDPSRSVAYNPLAHFEQTREIADRVAGLLPTGGDHLPFRNFAWDVVGRVAQAVRDAGWPMTLARLRRGIERMEELAGLLPPHRAAPLKQLLAHPREHFQKMTSALGPALARLTSGSLKKQLSPEEGGLGWPEAARERLIVYFFLGSMRGADSAQAVAKLALLDLQAFVGTRYGGAEPPEPFSLFVDEFSDVAMPEFVGLLNKSRGAGIAIALATQTFSDLEASLGSEARAMQVLGNASTLVQFRSGNEQDAALFSRLAGREPARVVSSGHSYEPALLGSGSEWVEDFRAVHSRQVQVRDEELLPAHYAARLANLHAFARIGGTLYKLQVPLVEASIGRPFSERP